MDELLIKYLIGEADDEEQRTALDWINTNDENRRHFNQLKFVWEKSKTIAIDSSIDENKAWEKFKKKINTEQKQIPFTSKKSTWKTSAAAAVIFLFLGAATFYYLLQRNPEIIISSNNKVLIDTLSDGTLVTLNKNSKLIYKQKFESNSRKVQLIGEGFFQVTPNVEKPFLIHVEDVEVKVVGTSFNIKQAPEHIQIIVETGIVKVSKKANTIQLLPHQKATVFPNKNQPVVEQNEDEFYNFYRTNEFVCNATPLWKLVDALNTAYNGNITISNPNIRNLKITTTFKNNSLNEITTILAQTLNIQVEENNGEITLK